MNRRAFLGALALLAPVGAEAQPAANVYRVGALLLGRSPSRCLGSFQQGLKQLGHSEGTHYTVSARFSQGEGDVWRRLAAELVELKADVIFTDATLAAQAAKQATSTIPIVIGPSVFPVESGLVASLARPGGNVTGIAMLTPDLLAKRVEILKEAVPSVSALAVLRFPGRIQDLMVNSLEGVAKRFAIRLVPIEVGRTEDLVPAFHSAVRRRAGAVMSTQAELFFTQRAQIAKLAFQHRLPSLSGEPGAAEAGALIFHGPDALAACRRAAYFVDRIVKGANAAEIPVEQPTKIELVINLKTAKALGLTIPPSLLARADQVIE